ncbi:MAG: DapH/DapD/GlmU-related protein [Bacteroidota bacterium]|nr:DapH/DapD/GlmU-related protein [Bacteroidota bacterium]
MKNRNTLIILFKKIRQRIKGDTLSELISMGLKVGRNFNPQNNCIIDYSHCWLIEIGDNVTLAPNVHILAHDASTKMHIGYTRIGKVMIGNNVFIGAGAIILPNVNIGDNVIIGDGSVVSKNIPENSVVIGNPCKIIGRTIDFTNKHKEYMKTKPCFGLEYTLRGKITSKMKNEMKTELKDSFGYVI